MKCERKWCWPIPWLGPWKISCVWFLMLCLHLICFISRTRGTLEDHHLLKLEWPVGGGRVGVLYFWTNGTGLSSTPVLCWAQPALPHQVNRINSQLSELQKCRVCQLQNSLDSLPSAAGINIHSNLSLALNSGPGSILSARNVGAQFSHSNTYSASSGAVETGES